MHIFPVNWNITCVVGGGLRYARCTHAQLWNHFSHNHMAKNHSLKRDLFWRFCLKFDPHIGLSPKSLGNFFLKMALRSLNVFCVLCTLAEKESRSYFCPNMCATVYTSTSPCVFWHYLTPVPNLDYDLSCNCDFTNWSVHAWNMIVLLYYWSVHVCWP